MHTNIEFKRHKAGLTTLVCKVCVDRILGALCAGFFAYSWSQNKSVYSFNS
jgi:hypothetical protein